MNARVESSPLPNRYYDVLLSTQVTEPVDSLDFALEQMSCVIKTGGVIILPFPFLYNVHGANDHRRFTHYGADKLLPGYKILKWSLGRSGEQIASPHFNFKCRKMS